MSFESLNLHRISAGHQIPIVLIIPTLLVEKSKTNRYIQSEIFEEFEIPVSCEDAFQISLLIRADYFWDFIEDQIVRGGVITFRPYSADTQTMRNLRNLQHFDTTQS